jgi:hypothetical protein
MPVAPPAHRPYQPLQESNPVVEQKLTERKSSVTDSGWHWIPVVGTAGSLALLTANLFKAAALGIVALCKGKGSEGLRNAGHGIAKYGIGLGMSLVLTLIGIFVVAFACVMPPKVTVKNQYGYHTGDLVR